MSEQFWRDNAYADNEPDRVILCVDLKAEQDNHVIWHKTYKMDAWGDTGEQLWQDLCRILSPSQLKQ